MRGKQYFILSLQRKTRKVEKRMEMGSKAVVDEVGRLKAGPYSDRKRNNSYSNLSKVQFLAAWACQVLPTFLNSSENR